MAEDYTKAQANELRCEVVANFALQCGCVIAHKVVVVGPIRDEEDAKRVMAEEMKRIRRKLHFTQKSAVQLLSGGGHNAFSRYERAEVEPPKPLFVLMRLLDRHPELVRELQAINECADINALLVQKQQQREI